MKALKEKRLSLRSLLRRGLVILSLFALAFASCADSSDDGGGGGETTTGQPPAPSHKTAVSIVVSKGPDNDWYQGLPPDPAGVEIDVVWSTGPEINHYTYTDFANEGFSIWPAYCDEPGKYPNAGDFYVTYPWGGQSLPIKYKGVIYLASIGEITLEKVYADQMVKNLVGEKLNLKWVWKEDTDADVKYGPQSGITHGAPTETKEQSITVNSAYPPASKFEYTTGMAATNTKKYFQVVIGGLKTGGANPVKGKVNIKKYMQVVDIKANYPDDFFAFDDEIDIDAAPYADDDGNIPSVNAELSAKLKNVTFTVYYQDLDLGPPEQSSPITWATFVSRVADAHEMLNISTSLTAAPIKIKSDGTKDENMEKGYWAGNDEKVLQYNEDDVTWGVGLEYVPKEYLTLVGGLAPGNYARVGVVEVAIPVAEFQTDLEVQKRYSTHEYALVQYSSSIPATMDEIMVKNINDRWLLIGTYKLASGATKTKYITFNSKMFYYGIASPYIGNGIDLSHKNGQLSKADTASFTSGLAFTGDEDDRAWGLPLRYRTATVDADDSVKVNLIRIGTKVTP